MQERREEIRQMLRTIEAECEYTWRLTGRRSFRPEVMEAMGTVPRDEFVPLELKRCAFANNALPIGEGQTISQPFIVALMTDLLNPEPGHTVLEVGTGSGYQAAILSLLVKHVYSVEIVENLASEARLRLDRLGYGNVTVRNGDGYRGWCELAPFDGIIVTAAAPHLPQPLVEQLGPGGRLVIPIGRPYMPQELVLVEKDTDGKVSSREVLGVAFVPLTGEGRRTGGG